MDFNNRTCTLYTILCSVAWCCIFQLMVVVSLADTASVVYAPRPGQLYGPCIRGACRTKDTFCYTYRQATCQVCERSRCASRNIPSCMDFCARAGEFPAVVCVCHCYSVVVRTSLLIKRVCVLQHHTCILKLGLIVRFLL